MCQTAFALVFAWDESGTKQTFWTVGRQPLPNRVTSELPVIRN
jgi:hypothetical protein